jgi:hypothetical protein
MPVRLLPWPETQIGCIVITTVLVLAVAGCGKGPVQRDVAADSTKEEATEGEAAASTPVKDRKSASKKKRAAPGKKIGGIPIDVWPEVWLKDPLAVAAEKGPASGAPAATTSDSDPAVAKTGTDGPPAGTEKTAAGGAEKSGGSDWTALISGEALADEAKAVKNSLTQNLQDVGRYNSKWKDVKIDSSELAALAGVAIEHPDAPSWKANARFIRDAASQIASESKANGEKFYTPAKKAYDRLEALLSGSKPPDVEEAAERVKFSEVANRYSLMKRLERARDWLKSEINSEAALKKESARVGREAAVLSMLGKVIETPDYPDADDDEYRNFAQIVIQSGVEIQESVKNQDFKAFAGALDRCAKACNQCHEQFKSSSGT